MIGSQLLASVRMGDGETPEERGERLYRNSWVSQLPDWYTGLFRIWWLTGVAAAVVIGGAVDAWKQGGTVEAAPAIVLSALLGLAAMLQFRSWRNARRGRPQQQEWKRPWM